MLKALLHAALPWLSSVSWQVLDALAECQGWIGGAAFLARRVGFRSRHQLARLLHREGLPPLEELAGWVRVLAWVLAWETRGMSLCRLALAELRDPAMCYRLVKRVTGQSWSRVRDNGSWWLSLRLRDRCRAVGHAGVRRVAVVGSRFAVVGNG